MLPHQDVRTIKLDQLLQRCLALDLEYGQTIGVVVVARRIAPGGDLACVWSRLQDAARGRGTGYADVGGRFGSFPYGRDDDKNPIPVAVHRGLMNDDLALGEVGHGYPEFFDVASRAAILGIDVPFYGRFGDLSPADMEVVASRLVVFLAGYATQTVGGSAIPARIEPFDAAGVGPVPADRAAILDPAGKACGQPYAVVMQQGLFIALWEAIYRSTREQKIADVNKSLVADLIDRMPRKAALVRMFLQVIGENSSMDRQQIVDEVWGENGGKFTSEESVRQLVNRVNREMEAVASPVRFSCGSGLILRADKP